MTRGAGVSTQASQPACDPPAPERAMTLCCFLRFGGSASDAQAWSLCVARLPCLCLLLGQHSQEHLAVHFTEERTWHQVIHDPVQRSGKARWTVSVQRSKPFRHTLFHRHRLQGRAVDIEANLVKQGGLCWARQEHRDVDVMLLEFHVEGFSKAQHIPYCRRVVCHVRNPL